MIGRAHRFHGHGGLRATYQKGRTIRGPQVSLRFAQRPSDKPYRMAVVVSRQVSKSAVVRNRIRRRLYEAVRRSTSQPPVGLDMIFTVFSPEVAKLSQAQLQNLLDGLLRKTGRPDISESHPRAKL